MAKQTQSPYNSILADIRKKKFAPIYILMGEEAYFIDELTNALQELVIPEDERDFNQTILYGADATMEMVTNTARQFPVMTEKQLVMLKEAQTLHDAKRQLEKIAPYAANPVMSTVLVITFKGDSLSATSKLIKETTKAGGVVFESKKIQEWQLESMIKDYCKEHSIKIDTKSAAILGEFIGTNLKRLFSEIEKLMVSLPSDSRVITPELIERNIGFSKDFNNFELIKAIASRNYAKTMQIVDYFESNPKQNPVIVSTSMVFNLFSNILLAHYAPDKSDNGLMAQLRVKFPRQLEDIKAGMRSYNARRAISIISAIRELDCKSKGINSQQKDYSLLKELVYKIFTI